MFGDSEVSYILLGEQLGYKGGIPPELHSCLRLLDVMIILPDDITCDDSWMLANLFQS